MGWASASVLLVLSRRRRLFGVENGPNRFRPGRLSDVALTWFNVRVVKNWQVALMKISDFTCSSCASSYEVAESMSAEGSPGRAECVVCGALLEAWQEPRMKAYRLVLAPKHKYPQIPVPPSPPRCIVA